MPARARPCCTPCSGQISAARTGRRAQYAGVGVGDDDDPHDARHIFDMLPAGSLKTEPLKIDTTFFCYRCNGMATGKTCPHEAEERLAISGTRLREMLAKHEPIPPEFSRAEVIAVLQEYYDRLGRQ